MDTGKGARGGKGGRWQNKKKNVATDSTPSKGKQQDQETRNLLEKTNFTFIDGCEGEGGGQVLRNTISLAALLKKPIHIKSVRGKRDRPGLQKQHLTGLNLVTKMCSGLVDGAHVGSGEVLFIPKELINKSSYEADIQSAGSILLLIQISLPVLLFSPQTTQVTYKGGTNASNAPQFDYFEKVFYPVAKKFGFEIQLKIQRRGFYPKGMGSVSLSVPPVKTLQPLTMDDPGQIKSVEICTFHAGQYTEEDCKTIVSSAKEILSKFFAPEIEISSKIVTETRDTAFGTGIGVLIRALTSTDCIIAGSALDDKGKVVEDLGPEAANELIRNIKEGGCVDEYLADQLIIFMALADGKSRIKTGPLSLHTTTSIHFSQLMTGAKFNVVEVKNEEMNTSSFFIECDGIAYQNTFLS